MVGIFFIMPIDPCSTSAPFASIREESYFKGEDEILFSMHTVFRVGAIKQIDSKNQLYQVELQLALDDDQELRLLSDRIREEVDVNKADELYIVLIEQTFDGHKKALVYFEHALDIWQRLLPPTHRSIKNAKESIEFLKQQS
ncbi:hypothetical protein I4U23_016203 [Adineta vaga]|nr:hypothetical protein I4U23_016203 [Adineta vaga]